MAGALGGTQPLSVAISNSDGAIAPAKYCRAVSVEQILQPFDATPGEIIRSGHSPASWQDRPGRQRHR